VKFDDADLQAKLASIKLYGRVAPNSLAERLNRKARFDYVVERWMGENELVALAI
jgi:hypothetical protein